MRTKKVAYFSMEFAIHQGLKIYSGGLGFLAGSHMRSAYELKQDVIGIGILYSTGYYDQVRNAEGYMEPKFIRKFYSFLQDTGIVFPIIIHGTEVKVKALYLPPEVFGSAPLYLLTTDIPENDFLSRTITYRLYDADLAAKIAQYMVLGIGGGKLLDILNEQPDIYHLNEGHGLPLLFHLYSKFRNIEEVKKRFVFTTHTPELAGNDEISLSLLDEMSFFNGVPLHEVKQITKSWGNTLNFTLTALRFAKIANAVSKIHQKVSLEMWGRNEGICPIIPITNAQNKKFWMDPQLEKLAAKKDKKGLLERKRQMKKELFEVVLDQTGKIFDENVLTIVWARRFAGYKRADLLVRNYERFISLVTRSKKEVQIIWAGKPYPLDYGGIDTFNRLVSLTKGLKNCAVLVGYEMKLSSLLKKGSDVWLNNPRITREASGTSGMTAAMNGSVNFSIPDGWVPEFAEHGKNCFVIPADPNLSWEDQDREDNQNMMNMLENEIVPLYYNEPEKWADIMINGINDVVPAFDADRMATEYYEYLYNYEYKLAEAQQEVLNGVKY